MRKVVVITPQDARYGFFLAGVRQLIAAPLELPAMLRQLMRDPATGVILVDERLISAAAQEVIRETERRWPGLVIVLPAPDKAARVEEDYALRLIRRAIGYQVRLGS